MRYIIAALLSLFTTFAQAQAPTRLCFSLTNGDTSHCVPVDTGNPLPVSGSFSITGFSSNNNFGSLTATGSTSASTALPSGGGTAVRISNSGTTAVSCTLATGAATGLISNIYVNAGSAVVRQVGTYDHIACIDQSGSVSNLVTLEGGSGLGNDSGGGGGGSGGLSVTDAASWTTAVSSFTPTGGVFNDSAAVLTSGQQGTVRLTNDRQFKVLDSATLAAIQAPIPACNTTPCNIIGITQGQTIPNVTPTACGGTVVTGGTAVNAFTAQSTLHGFTIANIDTSEVLWISFTTTALASDVGSYPLAAATATTFAGLSSYSAPYGYGMNTALSVVAATNGHKFSCTRW